MASNPNCQENIKVRINERGMPEVERNIEDIGSHTSTIDTIRNQLSRHSAVSRLQEALHRNSVLYCLNQHYSILEDLSLLGWPRSPDDHLRPPNAQIFSAWDSHNNNNSYREPRKEVRHSGHYWQRFHPGRLSSSRGKRPKSQTRRDLDSGDFDRVVITDIGDAYQAHYRGKSVGFKKTIGMKIRLLITDNPGKIFSAQELCLLVEGHDPSTIMTYPSRIQDSHEEGRKQYQQLNNDLIKARSSGNHHKEKEIQTALKFLANKQISPQAVISPEDKRAADRVRRNLKTANKMIGREFPELLQHLVASTKLGSLVSYIPQDTIPASDT